MTIPNFNHKDGDLDIACDDILRLINIHQEFLFSDENLKILAYILWRWESLYNNARIVYSEEQCTISPIDKLEFGNIIQYKDLKWYKIAKAALKNILSEHYIPVLENRIKTNSYFDTLVKPVYDDWDVLYWKKNKTMDEWIFLLSNPKHKSHVLYQHPKNIKNHLLCLSNNSYKWNKEGYLDTSIKISLFGDYMYSKDELPSFIKEPLFEILNRLECIYTNNKAWEIIEDITDKEIKKRLKSSNLLFDSNLTVKEKYDIYTQDIKKMILNRGLTQPIPKYGISTFSLLISAPKNLNESYINYIREISYEILKNKELYEKNQIELIQKFIKKNPLWFRKKNIEKLFNSK